MNRARLSKLEKLAARRVPTEPTVKVIEITKHYEDGHTEIETIDLMTNSLNTLAEELSDEIGDPVSLDELEQALKEMADTPKRV